MAWTRPAPKPCRNTVVPGSTADCYPPPAPTHRNCFVAGRARSGPGCEQTADNDQSLLFNRERKHAMVRTAHAAAILNPPESRAHGGPPCDFIPYGFARGRTEYPDARPIN